MGRRTIILVFLLAALCPLPVFSSAGDYEKGLSAFKSGHNAEAAAYFLAAVRQGDAQNPSARYYLATAFLRLGRVEEALHEYRACLELKPDREMAAYCRQALQYYDKGAAPSQPVTQNNALITPVPLPPSATQSEIKIDGSKLPRIPSFSYDGPSLVEVQSWDYERQAEYVDTAQEKLDRALNQLDQLTSCRRRAEKAVQGQVPSAKAYGESEGDFKARYDALERQVSDLLTPYKLAEEKQAGFVDLTRAVNEICSSAASRFSKRMPTGCRRSCN